MDAVGRELRLLRPSGALESDDIAVEVGRIIRVNGELLGGTVGSGRSNFHSEG